MSFARDIVLEWSLRRLERGLDESDLDDSVSESLNETLRRMLFGVLTLDDLFGVVHSGDPVEVVGEMVGRLCDEKSEGLQSTACNAFGARNRTGSCVCSARVPAVPLLDQLGQQTQRRCIAKGSALT